MRDKLPKRKPSKVKSGNICPWLVDVPLDHMK